MLGKIRYRITVLRRFARDAAGARVEVAPAITAELRDIEHACDLPAHFEEKAVLTLELEDRRLWDFRLTDPEGRAISAGRGLRDATAGQRRGRKRREPLL